MRREEEETEELRKMLRSADQTRKSYGEYRNSSDRQVNELASLLGAIDSGVGNERPSRPSLSSTTLPPQPPASSTTAGYSSRLSSDRTFRPSQVQLN